MVVAYRVEAIARMVRRILKLDTIVLANLALGEKAIPEFLDEQSSPENLAAALLPLLSETPARTAQLAALARLDEVMRVPAPPSDRAAKIVIEAASTGATRTAGKGRSARQPAALAN
jgi:lipid-A-disaccharide synthase